MTGFETVAGPFSFTEGPVWDGSRIIFTDIPSSRIMAFDPRTSETVVLHEGTGKANGLALDSQGRLYACQDEGRSVIRFEADGTRTVVADSFEGRRLNSPNDLSIDGEGRIWFSDPRYGPNRDDLELDHESVYVATPIDGDDFSWDLRRAASDTTRPNGVLLSVDRQNLFVAQTHMPPPAECRELRAYEIEPDHTLGRYEVMYDFGDHRGVDGMATAPDGSLLVACGWTNSGPGPRIAVFGPDRQLAVEFPTPANPSNLCFGGEEKRDLYVTGASGELWRMASLLDSDGLGPWRSGSAK